MTNPLTFTAKCTAPEELFGPAEEVPEELWIIVGRMGSLGCEGGGVPGFCCQGCEFMEEEVETEDG